MKSLTRVAVCLLALALPALAADKCRAGDGSTALSLWDGYTIQISAGYEAHAGQCHATVQNQASVTVFDVYAYDIQQHDYSGKDVNNDGKPDLILFGHIGKDDPYTYWIVSLAEPAGLARQITSVYPLTFEDRDGDGKMEIWTREWSFNGIDGLDEGDSPHPPVAFRLTGSKLMYVSNQFPLEYEPEIIQAKQHITDDGVTALKNEESTGMQVQKEKAGAKDHDDPKMDAKAVDTEIGVLAAVVNYLYSGQGEKGWKLLQENWGYRDRDRIRQLILRQRMMGMMRQLNAPQPGAANQATAQAPQGGSTPQ
jgi:hypothetical protein